MSKKFTLPEVRFSSNQYVKGAMVIENKRWYFRLVHVEGNENRSRALLQDFPINTIRSHLVVCFIPDEINRKVNDYEFRKEKIRNKNGEFVHLYAYFDSYIELMKYIRKFDMSKRTFFEVIVGEFPQKPHFDIDISRTELSEIIGKCSVETLNKVAEEVLEKTLSCVIEVLKNKGVEINMSKDVLIYESNGDKEVNTEKRSYHLVINNWYHINNNDASGFYDKVMEIFCLTHDKYRKFIDESVYKSIQQFRLVGSQKINSGRPKKFLNTFTFNGIKYEHKFKKKISEDIKCNVIMKESLVSFISDCKPLPSFETEVRKEIKVTTVGLSVIPVDQIDEIFNRAKHKFIEMLGENEFPFSILEKRDNSIYLKRKRPSFCPVCHVIHENQNPYLYVVKDSIYWNCRQWKRHVQDELASSHRFYIGKIKSNDSDDEDKSKVEKEENNLILGDLIIYPDGSTKKIGSSQEHDEEKSSSEEVFVEKSSNTSSSESEEDLPEIRKSRKKKPSSSSEDSEKVNRKSKKKPSSSSEDSEKKNRKSKKKPSSSSEDSEKSRKKKPSSSSEDSGKSRKSKKKPSSSSEDSEKSRKKKKPVSLIPKIEGKPEKNEVLLYGVQDTMEVKLLKTKKVKNKNFSDVSHLMKNSSVTVVEKVNPFVRANEIKMHLSNMEPKNKNYVKVSQRKEDDLKNIFSKAKK